MLKYFMESLKEFFKSPTIQDNLEAYIVSNNPQTSDDVDRLEREFYYRKSMIGNSLFYHE
jgi:hypothetical protein